MNRKGRFRQRCEVHWTLSAEDGAANIHKISFSMTEKSYFCRLKKKREV